MENEMSFVLQAINLKFVINIDMQTCNDNIYEDLRYMQLFPSSPIAIYLQGGKQIYTYLALLQK